MAERFRLYRGGTELDYSTCSIVKTYDEIVNSGFAEIEANANVTQSSVIDIKLKDGSTTIFSSKVTGIKESLMWALRLMTNGYELTNIYVENVYTNQSPEAIVEDIINTYSRNLTYASTATSGVVITKYIADGYLIDVIRDMVNVLRWQIRMDELDNVYFEPLGNLNNGVTFTQGSDEFEVTDWDTDQTKMFNKVKVIGGFEDYAVNGETKAGANTTWALDQKPSGNMRARLSATPTVTIDPDTYVVNAEDQQVVHDASVTNPIYDYNYLRPITFTDQDDDSINDNDQEIFRKVQAPWLNVFDDVKRYAAKLLETFSIPPVTCLATQRGFNVDVDVGETVTVVDNERSKNEVMVITKITYVGEMGETTFEMGDREAVILDWQVGVQDRIKALERRFSNTETLNIGRKIKHNMNVDLSIADVWEKNSPENTFALSHTTLSRMKDANNRNHEVDCSGAGHQGLWTGTGIDGAQFTTTGQRLSAGEFNGSDRKITVGDHADLDLASDFSICLAIKVASLPGAEKYIMSKYDGTDGWAIRINASDQVELIYSNSGSDSVIAASTALTANTFQHVIFTKSGTDLIVYVQGASDNTGSGDAAAGTNAVDVLVGNYGADYFNGFIDEVRLFTRALDSTEANSIYTKHHVFSGSVLYLSMDDPVMDDNYTARVTIT